MDVKSCPKCMASVLQNQKKCAICGHELNKSFKGAMNLEEEEICDAKKKEQAQFAGSVQAKMRASVKGIDGVKKAALIVAWLGFAAATIWAIIYLVTHQDAPGPILPTVFTIWAISIGLPFALQGLLSAIENWVMLAALKKANIDVNRFTRIGLYRVAFYSPQGNRGVDAAVEFYASINGVVAARNHVGKDIRSEATMCRLGMLAANPAAEKKFRIETILKLIFMVLSYVFLGFLFFKAGKMILSMPLHDDDLAGKIALETLPTLLIYLGLMLACIIVYAVSSKVLKTSRLAEQQRWLNNGEYERQIAPAESVVDETGSEQPAQATDEFAEFDLSSFDL